MARTVLPGKPYPQGPTWDGVGTNFSIYSEVAEAVELCLFPARDQPASETYRLPEVTGNVWHIYLVGIKPGQLYGYRIHGPYDPERGLRFNPAKLLVDPYAKAIAGQVDWNAPVSVTPSELPAKTSRRTRRTVLGECPSASWRPVISIGKTTGPR